MDLGRELAGGLQYPTTYHPYATTPLSTPSTPIHANGILLGTYGSTSPYRRIAPAVRSPAAAAFHNPADVPNILNPVEPTSTQPRPTRDRFQCNLPGCRNRVFARLSDLQRHAWSHHEVETRERVETPSVPKAIWRCDYRRCGRSLTPFHRLDHYRDHLRDQHREDLPRRRSKPDAVWWSQRNPHCVVEGWWRCNKCLVVRVNKETHGYVCPGCGVPIDAQRKTFREALLALPQIAQVQEGAEVDSKSHSSLELLDG